MTGANPTRPVKHPAINKTFWDFRGQTCTSSRLSLHEFPSHLLSLPYFSSSLPFVTEINHIGSHRRQSPAPPTTVHASVLIARRVQPFSARVDWRLTVQQQQK